MARQGDENPLDPAVWERLIWIRSEIARRRKKEKLTDKEFADAIGCTPSAITNWRYGHSPLGPKMAQKIERKHGIRAEWLLHGEPPRRKPDESQEDRYQEGIDDATEAMARTMFETIRKLRGSDLPPEIGEGDRAPSKRDKKTG